MKKFGVCTILSIGVFCDLLLLAPFSAYADTVTLTSINYGPMSGVGSGGGNVYPYGFTVSGTTGIVPLMCLSYESSIDPNNYWTATKTPVAGNTGYEEAAYIFSLAVAPGALPQTVVDAQWADWALFDPSLTKSQLIADGLSSTGPDNDVTNVENLLTNAQAWVNANPNSPLYSQYVIYVPTSNIDEGSKVDIPQTLIGFAAPEPGSFILLGSGMLGLAAFFYGRKRKGVKSV